MSISMKFWTHLLLILAVARSFTWAARDTSAESRIVSNLFDTGYDKDISPNANSSGPVVVHVNLFVRNLGDLNSETMTYKNQITLRQQWEDPRLKYDSVPGLEYVILNNFDKIWYPDLFVSNGIDGRIHNFLVPNKLLRIFPNGTVLFSVRISLELFSSMDFRYYPMDKQKSSIILASYAHTADDIVFKWKEENPVQMSKSQMREFELLKYVAGRCDAKTVTGVYSCIKLDFYLCRFFTRYLIYVFMPSLLLVVLSWITFWLNQKSLIIRLGIWIAIFLAMILLLNDAPRVTSTGITAMNVWLGTCFMLIICVLIQLCLVYNVINQEGSSQPKNELATNGIQLENGKLDLEVATVSRPTNYTALPLKWLNKFPTRAQRIDAVSRILFPAVFAVFNFVYWIVYTSYKIYL